MNEKVYRPPDRDQDDHLEVYQTLYHLLDADEEECLQ